MSGHVILTVDYEVFGNGEGCLTHCVVEPASRLLQVAEKFNAPVTLFAEAAELMEHFLWIDAEASRQAVRDPATRSAVADEMADVACYLLALSNTLGLDLSAAILAKLEKTGRKYPVERIRGRYKLDAGETPPGETT